MAAGTQQLSHRFHLPVAEQLKARFFMMWHGLGQAQPFGGQHSP
jgi:hypothetical protein